MRGNSDKKSSRIGREPAFSLAELLVVVGIIALLISLLLAPLKAAQYQAMRVKCATHLQQIGVALDSANTEFRCYPLWDDNTDRVRFTWMDVLVQRRFLGDYRVGYCPMDMMPDPFNQARGQALRTQYPMRSNQTGMDYSYGLGMPLSAAGWKLSTNNRRPGDDLPRRFDEYDRFANRRVLAIDAYWSFVYNLSGNGGETGQWNDPTWFDNMVAWRHPDSNANALMQDGHVEYMHYKKGAAEPVNTARAFVWYPGEPLQVGPDSRHGMNLYPDLPPPRFDSNPPGDVFPKELMPSYYTSRGAWTRITHKSSN